MRRALLISLLLIAIGHAVAQTPKARQKAFYLSAGPNYYLNNFDYFKNAVDQSHVSLGARFMWEGEHRLSLGIKSGFYWIYSVTPPVPGQPKANLTGIPIQPCVAMRFFKDFQVTYSVGPTLLFNNITSDQGEIFSDSFLSTADMSVSAGYVKKLTDRLSFGGEIEYFRSSKAQDNLFSLSFVVRVPL